MRQFCNEVIDPCAKLLTNGHYLFMLLLSDGQNDGTIFWRGWFPCRSVCHYSLVCSQKQGDDDLFDHCIETNSLFLSRFGRHAIRHYQTFYPINTMDIAEVAERFNADRYAVGLTGIELVQVEENCVKTKLVVEPKHMNAFGIMQGGALFTLADFTFAVAINAGQPGSSVAIECQISFLKPISEGVLHAEAQVIFRSRSLVACDVTLTNDLGELVAKFHGRGFVRQSAQ